METTLSDVLSSELLNNLPHRIARRRVDTLTKLDMVALRKTLSMRYDSSYASSVVSEVLNQLEFCAITGETRENELFGWRLPLPRNIDLLLSMLEGVSFRRQQAVIVTALSDRPLIDACSMRHKHVPLWLKESVNPELSRSIIQSLPRYISSDLVFWETYQGRCWPMLDLENEITGILNVSWSDYRSALRSTARKKVP